MVFNWLRRPRVSPGPRVLVCGDEPSCGMRGTLESLAPSLLIFDSESLAGNKAAFWSYMMKVKSMTVKRGADYRASNQRMLDRGRPTLVLAFPGGEDVEDMVTRARAAGIEVRYGE